MGCTVVYPASPGSRTPWRLVKGQLDGKPCRWHVTLWYDVPLEALEPDEKNPRRLVVKVRKPMWLQDITAELQPIIDAESASCGAVTNIRWLANQER